MLRINKKVEYALMALKFIWENKDPGALTSAREVCDKFHAPFDTVAKVMQSMNNAGILHSSKGIKGGYQLAQDLSLLTYMDLVNIIEKKQHEDICHSDKGVCELYDSCNIVAPIDKLNRTLNQYLETLSIKNLFEMSFGNSSEKIHSISDGHAPMKV
jgi:Rrf2 family nitric oxide-sensitive transcriptional repressor